MHSHHPHQPLTNTLLQHLASEETLLRNALVSVTEIHAALRRGDLAAALALSMAQQAQGAALRAAANERTNSATALARELGIAGEELRLSAIAAKLPDSLAIELQAVRERLTAVTAELNAIQIRNANLIGHLRSFFRGVLSDLTAPGAPQRYGPSGSRLEAITGTAGARITS
jgi:hypothetical protein